MTRKINELEEFLNKKLLLRDTRNLKLTAEGEVFYQRFKHLQNQLHDTKKSLNPKEVKIVDDLKIALPIDLSYDLISPYLADLTRKNPEVNLDITYQRLPPKMHENKVDLAVTCNPINDARYDYRFLRYEVIKFYCTPDYKLKYGLPLTIDELHNHNFIGGVDPSTGNRMNIVPIYNKSTGESYLYDNKRSHLRVNSVIQAKQIGLSGEYIFACWNSICEDEIRQGKLIPVLTEYEAYRQEFFLVSKKTLILSNKGLSILFIIV